VNVPGMLCPEIPISTDPNTSKVSSYSGINGAGRNGEQKDLEDDVCGDINIDGVLYPESRTTIAMILDGTSNTFLVGERLLNFRDWMQGAMRIDEPATTICSGASQNIRYPLNADPWQFGFHVADDGAPPGAAKTMLLNDLQFGSQHAGGAHFGYADGSIHFLNDEMDFNLYQDLATRNGCEEAGAP
jgi:prepilin-type processing-associated H-X9-DG protein